MASGATLSGAGTVGAVTANGTVSAGVAGVGTLDTGNLAFATGSHYNVQLTDNGCDQINVAGTVNLANASLGVTSTRTNADSEVFVLIQNDGTDAVTGTFLNLSEGSQVTVGGVVYFITYRYNAETGQFGSGNDVALRVAGEATLPSATTDGSLIVTRMGLKPSPSGESFRFCIRVARMVRYGKLPKRSAFPIRSEIPFCVGYKVPQTGVGWRGWTASA